MVSKYKMHSSVLNFSKTTLKRYYIAIVIANDDYSHPIFRDYYGFAPEVICVKPARKKIIELLEKTNFKIKQEGGELKLYDLYNYKKADFC